MAPEQFQGRAAPGSDVMRRGTALSLLTAASRRLPHKGRAIDVGVRCAAKSTVG